METLLGWTIMGKVHYNPSENIALTVINCLTRDAPVAVLWELDILGITDSSENVIQAAKDFFLRNH